MPPTCTTPAPPRATYLYHTCPTTCHLPPPAAFQEGHGIVFVYHYFYPFNGCSNQVLGISLSGQYQGIE